MNVVLNDKMVCRGETDLINVCEMMERFNSTKVRVDVVYQNRRGYECRRYRPCCIEFWDFGTNKSFNVFGDGFVSEWVVSVLRSHYSGSDVHVNWFDYDVPRSHAVSYL